MQRVAKFVWFLAVGVALSAFVTAPAMAANKVLKIGHIGVMSGPAASWGLINKYAALAGAEIINEDGGFALRAIGV